MHSLSVEAVSGGVRNAGRLGSARPSARASSSNSGLFSKSMSFWKAQLTMGAAGKQTRLFAQHAPSQDLGFEDGVVRQVEFVGGGGNGVESYPKSAGLRSEEGREGGRAVTPPASGVLHGVDPGGDPLPQMTIPLAEESFHAFKRGMDTRVLGGFELLGDEGRAVVYVETSLRVRRA